MTVENTEENAAIAAVREALTEFDSENVIIMAQRAAEEIARLRVGLRKIRAHTGLPPHPTHELLLGLIASIVRILNSIEADDEEKR